MYYECDWPQKVITQAIAVYLIDSQMWFFAQKARSVFCVVQQQQPLANNNRRIPLQNLLDILFNYGLHGIFDETLSEICQTYNIELTLSET